MTTVSARRCSDLDDTEADSIEEFFTIPMLREGLPENADDLDDFDKQIAEYVIHDEPANR